MSHLKFKNIFVLLLSMIVFFSVGLAIVAHADDDGKEINDDQYNQVAVPVVQSAPDTTVNVEKPKATTKTVVVPATTTIVNELQAVEFPDSDRDGLIDSEDPHPSIPEIYFVKDDNQNGIVDSFE